MKKVENKNLLDCQVYKIPIWKTILNWLLIPKFIVAFIVQWVYVDYFKIYNESNLATFLSTYLVIELLYYNLFVREKDRP